MSGFAQRSLAAGLGLGAVALLLVTGCSKDSPPAPDAARPAAQAAPPEIPAAPPKAVAAQTASLPKAGPGLAFKDAVLLEPPVADEQRPPDLTAGGKSTAALYEAIAGKDNVGGLWDQVRLTDDAGKTIKYQVTLTTAVGEVVIDLFPEHAPNHCRNFIALARAGYFDGLPFYRSVNVKDGANHIAYVESGCPKGTGEVGYGSLGYWLKPEIEGNKLTHEEGAVGAWHREELETAACRFYIAAQPMKQMDGAFTLFGKVSRGLDVVRTINQRPVNDDDQRLKDPVLIRRATVSAN